MERKKRHPPPLLLVLAVPLIVVGTTVLAYVAGRWVISAIESRWHHVPAAEHLP